MFSILHLQTGCNVISEWLVYYSFLSQLANDLLPQVIYEVCGRLEKLSLANSATGSCDAAQLLRTLESWCTGGDSRDNQQQKAQAIKVPLVEGLIYQSLDCFWASVHADLSLLTWTGLPPLIPAAKISIHP